MKRPGMLWVSIPVFILQVMHAGASPRDSQEPVEFPKPTPLEDPYMPPAGDPDIFAPEDSPGEAPSPLNPADN